MINPKLLVLLGVVLIVIGVFLPLATEESTGEAERLDFWDYDDANDLAADGIGIYLLAIALVGGLTVLVDRTEYIWVPVLLLVWYIIYQLPPIWVLNRNDLGFTPGAGWMLIAAGTWLLSAPLLWSTMSSDSTAEASDIAETTTSPGFNLLLVLRWAGLVLLVGGGLCAACQNQRAVDVLYTEYGKRQHIRANYIGSGRGRTRFASRGGVVGDWSDRTASVGQRSTRRRAPGGSEFYGRTARRLVAAV
ncbi:MAG: hypothetical protein K8S97_10535 [Anaerolineae bacterium]|nr:hypothetical protein [Anaerolineae bacterium]